MVASCIPLGSAWGSKELRGCGEIDGRKTAFLRVIKVHNAREDRCGIKRVFQVSAGKV